MISIAIDGPAGAGKSTLAKRLARELGFVYVDTGALYRAVAFGVLQNNINIGDETELQKYLGTVTVEIRYKNGEQRVLLNGEDVSDKIRTPEISLEASRCSALSPTRAFLLELQRELSRKHNVIMDGRDIGTVVLPNATLKIFLSASPEERARRRFDELKAKGEKVTYEDVLSDMKQRDYNDTHRKIAPLKRAADAVDFNNSGDSVEQSVEKLMKIIKGVIK